MPNETAREQTVCADMESIFGPPKGWYATHDVGIGTRNAVKAPAGRRRRAPGPGMIATAGAFLLLAVGVGLASGGVHGVTRVAAGQGLAPAGRASPPEAAIAYRAAPTVSMPPQIAQTVGSRAAPEAVAPETPRPRRIASRQTAAGFKVTTAAPVGRHTAPDPFTAHQHTRVAEIGPDRPCRPGEDEDRCIYRDVLSADARLRVAYAAAAREGVPLDELAAVRRRWVQASDISLKRPDEAIRRYDELADSLSTDDGYGPR